MTSLKTFLLVGGCLALSACNADLNRLMTRDAIEAPSNWQEAVQVDPIDENWIENFQSTELSSLINRALQHNIELKQQAYDVQIKEQQLISAQSSFFPTLDFSFSQKRSGLTEGGSATNAASIGLDLAYELDVWGKMSDSEREAKLALMSSQATFKQARQQLAADVATAWLDIIEAKKLLSLYLQRFANAQDNRTIIESGYEKGLNEALDVYLVRNELDAEQATIEQQKTAITTAIRTLERYLGEYPKGLRTINDDLPVLNSPMRTGLPKDLIERKASLNASWRDLLSANAALAYAHKARLPSLKFTADIKDSATLANQLFSGAPFAWSLLGSLSAPIFDAGKLASAEEVARLELRQAEAQYLSDVFEAYKEVENAISEELSLEKRFESTKFAAENAKIAADLSFQQYQRGLVEYTTVLESQTRYYDAEVSAIKIQSQLAANRIQLHLALGGDFAQAKTDVEEAR